MNHFSVFDVRCFIVLLTFGESFSGFRYKVFHSMYLLLTIGESFSAFRYKVFHGIYLQLISGESFSGFIPNWAQGSPVAEPLQDAGPFWEARVRFLSAHLRSALRLEAAEASLGGRHRKTEMDNKTCESTSVHFPSNARATFIQSTRKQSFLKTT